MKLSLLWAAALVFSTGSLGAKELVWHTDYEEAARVAAVQNKPLMLYFTGSDWCAICVLFDKEVASQPEFAAYANPNVVLVKVDFPRKTSLPEAVEAQNEALAAKYGIEGFPTFVVLSATGKKKGELGYQPGGAVRWMASLKRTIQR